MADQKHLTVQVVGSGRTYDVPVSPGDQPDDVLWEVVDDESSYTLRRGNDEIVQPETDVHETFEEGEVLFAATNPVVG